MLSKLGQVFFHQKIKLKKVLLYQRQSWLGTQKYNALNRGNDLKSKKTKAMLV